MSRAVGVHLEPVRALAQLCLGLLGLSSSGRQLLQLSLASLPPVLGLGLGLLQTLHLGGQLFVVTLQVLQVLLQVAFELGERGGERRSPLEFLFSMEEELTLLACSS